MPPAPEPQADPVTELVNTLAAVRRDVDRLRQDMQGTLKAAQAAESAAAKPRTLTLDVSALGPAFGTLSERVGALRADIAALDAGHYRDAVDAAVNEARSGLGAAAQGVRRETSRLMLRFTLALGLVVLGALGAQYVSVAATTTLDQTERTRLAAEVERLRLMLPELQARAEDWQRRAGRAVLSPCQSGTQTRLCARIDLSAPRFGTRGEDAVLDGY